MMFMTPTPPMTSEMRATKTMAPVMPPVMARNCEMSWSGVMSAKSLGWSNAGGRASGKDD